MAMRFLTCIFLKVEFRTNFNLKRLMFSLLCLLNGHIITHSRYGALIKGKRYFEYFIAPRHF